MMSVSASYVHIENPAVCLTGERVQQPSFQMIFILLC